MKNPLLNCVTYATHWRHNFIGGCIARLKPNGAIPCCHLFDFLRIHLSPLQIHFTWSRSPTVTLDDDFFICVAIVLPPWMMIALIESRLIAKTVQLIQPHFSWSRTAPRTANIGTQYSLKAELSACSERNGGDVVRIVANCSPLAIVLDFNQPMI